MLFARYTANIDQGRPYRASVGEVKMKHSSASKPTKISHIGIAVNDLEKAVADFGQVFNTTKVELIEVKGEGVRVAMIKVGDSEIELLSPVNNRGEIAKFLRKRGREFTTSL